VPPLDIELGMEAYATQTTGVGGSIKRAIEDFAVQEVLVDGARAPFCGVSEGNVLGSSVQRRRFLLCILVKRNWDTLVAVKKVAMQLGVEQWRVGIAGIKDAKAITAQHLTVEDAEMDDASKVNIKDLQLCPIGYVREPMSLYFLLGNYFTIKINSISFDTEIVHARITQTLDKLESLGGFPNFYGHQRFGTTRPITHHVGKALVQGDFEGAAMLFLAKPSPYEHPASRQARQQLAETKDFKAALQVFPKQLRFERLMLNHLADRPSDFAGAFRRLPTKLQELFVQAHQSYLFNRFLSGRIKAGLPLNMAEAGDFVVGVERSGLPLMVSAKVVTETMAAAVNEQAERGKLRVALPIVGVKQKLSGGVMGEVERAVLSEEQIDPESLRLNELSMAWGRGGLRTAITPIKDFKIQSMTATGESRQAELGFMLLRGCYATVLLREIMKPQDPVETGF
jgi:tRNA pseudouridine13 synthase